MRTAGLAAVASFRIECSTGWRLNTATMDPAKLRRRSATVIREVPLA